jgi:hypothetical protein
LTTTSPVGKLIKENDHSFFLSKGETMHASAMSTRRLGALTAVWGIVFAGFHFYWAAGGTLAHDPGGQSLADSLYIGFIALLGLAGAAVAHGLYRSSGARIGRRCLRTLARLGGTLLVLGVAVGVGRWITDGSLGDDGADGVAITAYFLLGGVLFSALGWLRDASPRRGDARSTTPRGGGTDALRA